MPRKEYEKVSGILTVVVIQTILILWLTLNVYLREVDGSYEIPGIAVRIPAILAILLTPVTIKLVNRLVNLAKAELDAEIYRLELQRSQELINSLRTQRHDFCTYLNVIMGLIQLGKPERAIDYICQTAKTLKEKDPVIRCEEHSILGALLVTKRNLAMNEGISFSVEFQTELENVKLIEHKLTRILGNIIDNAIEALKESQTPYKEIKVQIQRKNERIVFIIWNNGPHIPKVVLNKIFNMGYSTKVGGDRGLGLSIVKELLSEMDGSISVTSDAENGTSFIISVPFSLAEEEKIPTSLSM